MLNVMTQAKNAIEAYNEALKVSSANIANMSVPGYKKLSVSFQSIFEKVLSQGTAAEVDRGGTNPRQFGQGMSISGTSIDFSGGETASGSPLDLAISGSGLFIVSPDGGNTRLYTRAGNFEIDSSGSLTSNGMQVYGLDNSGNLVPVSGLQPGGKQNYTWYDGSQTVSGSPAYGALLYTSDPGATTPTYTSTGFRIALTYFANPSGLTQAQGTSFAESVSSGSPASPQAPGAAVGSIKPGQIEQSNVYYLAETLSALELQRAMSGNLSMVKMASDIISSFIQKLG
jgi:flagellar hook protein FlgE